MTLDNTDGRAAIERGLTDTLDRIAAITTPARQAGRPLTKREAEKCGALRESMAETTAHLHREVLATLELITRANRLVEKAATRVRRAS